MRLLWLFLALLLSLAPAPAAAEQGVPVRKAAFLAATDVPNEVARAGARLDLASCLRGAEPRQDRVPPFAQGVRSDPVRSRVLAGVSDPPASVFSLPCGDSPYYATAPPVLR